MFDMCWLEQKIDRSDMSSGLQNSTGSIVTTTAVDRYAEEIEQLISIKQSPRHFFIR